MNLAPSTPEERRKMDREEAIDVLDSHGEGTCDCGMCDAARETIQATERSTKMDAKLNEFTPLDEMKMQAQARLDRTYEDVKAQMRGLVRDLELAIHDVELFEAGEASVLNELGVVQQRGRDIDRLCAVIRERQIKVAELNWLAENI